jgi:hypothetical protein
MAKKRKKTWGENGPFNARVTVESRFFQFDIDTSV